MFGGTVLYGLLTCSSKQYHAWAPSYGMDVTLDQSLAGHSHNFCTTFRKKKLLAENFVAGLVSQALQRKSCLNTVDGQLRLHQYLHC